MSNNELEVIQLESKLAEQNENDSSDDSDESPKCVKLELPEHIASYLEERELLRDTDSLHCDNNLLEKITSNYIIAKQIISNLPWQQKILCKHVCSTWNSAIHALQKEQLSPQDFMIHQQTSDKKHQVKFKTSDQFYTEPLVVLTVVNTPGLNTTYKCSETIPHPCIPPCKKYHSSLDLVHHYVSAPKDCMLTIKSNFLSYMPLPQSVTHKHLITFRTNRKSHPFVGGVYIPVIPDVKFHIINIKSIADMQKDFFDVINKLCQDQIFKGVLVFATDKYLLHPVEDIVFLNYFKDVQPDIPYALGGCIVEDSINGQSDIAYIINGINEDKDYVSENLITIGMFTVPKNAVTDDQGEKNNFEIYSLVIESSDWAKSKIQQTINEFSKKVPIFEHSIGLKLSCIGRDQKHDLEQDYLRAAFPHTRIVGCYGNGELGLNYPARPTPAFNPSTAKRRRPDAGPQYGIMYSYSTVFMYIGWGKMTSQSVS